MFFPKKVKFRKWQRCRENPVNARVSNRGNEVSFGSLGLKAEGAGEIKSNQLDAARKAMAHYIQKSGKFWVRIFPNRPLTQKAAEVGMGKGKGDPVGFVSRVRPGRVIFEIDGLEDSVGREALRKAGSKLPVKTKVVSR